MAESYRCPQCGAEVPGDAPQGLCPNCVLKAGFGTQQTDSVLSAGSESASASSFDAQYVPPTPAELAPHFPDLEILELVGRGGMGVVYKARQKRLDRLVALKILAPKIGQDPAFAERFAREARAMAMLSHPHVVAVHDFGQTDGLYYFLMEFVDGVNLRRLLDTGKLAPEEALAIVPQICEALQYAHDHGVVHRDIKPENLLLDKEGRVKIADFGIAKLVGKEAKDLTLTGAGQIMGTLQYMAPEQIEHPLQVDHRADIYSLGVVFYQMLTGELPIGRFAPPSQKVQIDVRLDEVVLRALEKEPERRYQQAGEIKTRVETIATTPLMAPKGLPATSQRGDWRSWVMGVGVRSGRKVINWPVLIMQWPLVFAIFCSIWVLNHASGLDTGIVLMFAVMSAFLVAFLAWVQSSRSIEQLPTLDSLRSQQPQAITADAIEQARRQVQGPAIGLLVTGILNWIATPLIVLILFYFIGARSSSPVPTIGLIPAIILNLVFSSLMIFGSLKMKRLQSHYSSLGASIAAIIVTPGNVIGLPIGIWALVVLSQREVRAAFGLRGKTDDVGRASRARRDEPLANQGNTDVVRVSESNVVEKVRRQIQGPAIGLLVTGILNAVATFVVGMLIAWYVLWGVRPMPDLPVVLAFPFVPSMVFTIVIIAAALKMRRLDGYGWAVFGSILAMISGNAIGLATGIWALIVLSDAPVKKAFEEQTRLRFGGVPPQPTTWHRRFGGVALAMFLLAASLSLLALVFHQMDRLSTATFLTAIILEMAAILFGLAGWQSRSGKTAVVGAGFILLPVLTFLVAGLVEARMHWWRDSGSQPVPVANALEEYRRTLIGYDLGFDSVFPQQKWTRYDASRLEMYPTKDAWPHVLGHVDTNPNAFKVVRNESQYPNNPIAGPNAFMVPLDRGLVADSTYVTLLLLKGISPKGTVVAKTYASLVCIGSMEGRLSFDSYATALLKGDVSGQITSESYFDLVITGKFSGRILADSYAMIYLMGGCEGNVELKHGAKVYIAGRTTEASLSHVKGQGSVFLEDSDLPPGEHKLGDLNVTVSNRAGSSKSTGKPVAAGPVKAIPKSHSILKNSSIETGDKAPSGWQQGAAIEGVTYSWDKKVAFEGMASLCIEKTAQRYFPIAQWSQTVDRQGNGPTLLVSAQVKAENMAKAILDVAFLDEHGNWVSHQWAAFIGIKEEGEPPANHDWRLYSGKVEIPPQTKKLCIGLQVYGPGKVWFDDIRAGYADSLGDGAAVAIEQSTAVERPAISVTGRIEPESVVDVGAQVTGKIVSLGDDPRGKADPNYKGKTIDYGSPVEEGTVLAQIDDAIYKTRAELEKAKCERAEAELAAARAKAKEKAADPATITAEAAVAQAKSVLEEAEINLDRTIIRSPIKGVVVARRINVGQNVAPTNGPSLFLIAKGKSQVWAQVDEAEIGRIHKGMDAHVTADDLPKNMFKGKVTQIRRNPTVSRNHITYTVVVDVEDSEHKPMFYQTVNVHFLIGPETGNDQLQSFGPVIERVVNHSGKDCLIDLDSGKPFTDSPDVHQSDAKAALEWVAQNGIDAGGYVDHDHPGLIGFDMVVVPVANERWSNLTHFSLWPDAISSAKPGNPVFLTANTLPTTFIFKTREGGMGILQVVGFTDDPKGVNIRYRLAQQSPQKEMATPNSTDREDKETAKPDGLVLTYEVDPSSTLGDVSALDMDKLLNAINRRLNAGPKRLAQVRKMGDGRVEIAMMRNNDEDRQRVERLLAKPGTLEFRILASSHQDKAVIDRAEKEPEKVEMLDASGKRLAWWVPVKAGEEKNFGNPDIVRRTKKHDNHESTEILVVTDPYNVTGAYLTKAEVQPDRNGRPCIDFTLNDAGGQLFAKLTGDHLPDKATDFTHKLGIILDGELWSAPSIQSTIHNKGQITGSFTKEQAAEIADVLNAGSLPVRLRVVEPQPQESADPASTSERDGANEIQTGSQPTTTRTKPSDASSHKLILRLEKGGKLLVDGKAFSGDPIAILQRIRDDAAIQVAVEAGEGVSEDDVRRLRPLVNSAEKQRDPRNRQLWEQIAQRQDSELRKEALAKLHAMLASDRNADHDQAVRTLQKAQNVPFDRTPLLPLVRKLIADEHQSAMTRAVGAVQLANLGGSKEDIPVVAAMANDADSFVRKAVAPALYNLDPKGKHPLIAPAIEKLLSDESAGAGGVVHHTIKALWGRPVSPAAERRLIELSKQPGPYPSSGIPYDAVYYALSTRPVVSRSVAERLTELALSPNTQSLTGRAVWGLSHHPASRDARDLVADTLVRIFDDTLNAGLHQDCIFGLGLHGGTKAIKKLETIAASDENMKLREQAKAALKRAPTDAP